MIRATQCTAVLTATFTLIFPGMVQAQERTWEDGLVAHWSFNEGNGSSVHDDSGNGYEGLVQGATWVTGVIGSALEYDGLDDYVEIDPDVPLGTTHTICFWIRPTGFGVHRAIFKLAGSTDYAIYHRGNGSLGYKLGLWAAGHETRCSSVILSPDTWTFVTITRDGQDFAFYSNAVLTCEEQLSPDTPVRALSAIAHESTDRTFFAGIIDEVRIYSRVLDPQEIQAHYAGLRAHWSFNAGQGSDVEDDSGNGYEGVIYGAAWTQGVSGSALRFDGIDDYVDIAPGIPIGDRHTICFWLKPSSLGTGYGNAILTLSCGHCHIRLKPNGGVNYKVGIWADGHEVFCNGMFAIDTWTFVCITRDGLDVQFYKDGILTCVESFSPGAPTRNITALGYPASSGFFEGIIDEVRIYSRAVSDGEIRDLYWSVRPDPEEDAAEGDQADVSGTSADPVNTATGSFFHQETDLTIPSRGSPLTFTRFYNSKAAAPGRRSGKSGKPALPLKTATSQPASTRDGERAGIDAKKQNESPAGKDQEQAADSSEAGAKMKGENK